VAEGLTVASVDLLVVIVACTSALLDHHYIKYTRCLAASCDEVAIDFMRFVGPSNTHCLAEPAAIVIEQACRAPSLEQLVEPRRLLLGHSDQTRRIDSGIPMRTLAERD